MLHDLGPLIEGECMMINIRCFLQDFMEVLFGKGLREYSDFFNNTPKDLMDLVYEEHKTNLQVIGLRSSTVWFHFLDQSNESFFVIRKGAYNI